MTCQEIITILCKQAPEQYACSWDNVGLLVGDAHKEVRTIYIALDATEETIEEAVAQKADMLLTHHPMIFKGLKKVNTEDFIGKRVMSLIREDIAYYAMHTNFDVKGMADLAAEKIGLKDSQVLEMTCEDELGQQGIGKVGMLPDTMKSGMEALSFVPMTASTYGASFLRSSLRRSAMQPVTIILVPCFLFSAE